MTEAAGFRQNRSLRENSTRSHSANVDVSYPNRIWVMRSRVRHRASSSLRREAQPLKWLGSVTSIWDICSSRPNKTQVAVGGDIKVGASVAGAAVGSELPPQAVSRKSREINPIRFTRHLFNKPNFTIIITTLGRTPYQARTIPFLTTHSILLVNFSFDRSLDLYSHSNANWNCLKARGGAARIRIRS
jgi:hypothetical protein